MIAMEFPICAAVQMDDGYVIRGHRHNDCMRTAVGFERYAGVHIRQDMQGFVTSRNRFVGRMEACTLFKRAEMKVAHTGEPLPEDVRTLYSEDLY